MDGLHLRIFHSHLSYDRALQLSQMQEVRASHSTVKAATMLPRVYENTHARSRVSVRVRVRVRVCARVRACVRTPVCVRVCVCLCVWAWVRVQTCVCA